MISPSLDISIETIGLLLISILHIKFPNCKINALKNYIIFKKILPDKMSQILKEKSIEHVKINLLSFEKHASLIFLVCPSNLLPFLNLS